MIAKRLIGFFTDPYASVPDYDPGVPSECAACDRLMRDGDALKTISLSLLGGDRSLFFRTHKACWEGLSEEERSRIEGEIIDCEVGG
jgi:hypothetical protein